MLMYISKKYNVTHRHFFKLFDANGRKTKITLLFLLILLVTSILNPAPLDYYLEGLKKKGQNMGVDGLFDYTVPLVAALVISLAFFGDYKNKMHELLAFYNHAKFNYIMLYRWCFFVGLFVVGSFISGLFYYRDISFLDSTNILLSIRFIPNILFLCALVLCVTVLTKNSYAGLLVMFSYFLFDLLSTARLFKLLSLGTNMGNWYYRYSPAYYFSNRICLIVLSVVLVYIACKRSVRQ